MQYEDINIDALKSAIDLVFGGGAAEMVQKAYTAIASVQERAYHEGWSKGHEDGYAQANSDHEVIDMDNDGMLAEIEHQIESEELAEVEAEQKAYEAEQAFYNGDSGDETD